MRLVSLFIILLLPTISYSQVGLKYVQLNWNIIGHFDGPNFRQYINAYNLNGLKPPGVTDYGFKIRGADGFSFMTGFGTSRGKVQFTLSYAGGSARIDQFGDAMTPEWKKSLYYDYHNVNLGMMSHLLTSKRKSSKGLPRIVYHIGFGPEFNELQYLDKSGPNNRYNANNVGASTFLQYNFYTPHLGGPPIRVVWGVNLRYHASLKPVDFSSFQKDLNFSSTNKLSDGFKDLTLGVTLGFLRRSGAKNVKQMRDDTGKIRPTDLDINAFERNPASMLQLNAVDSVTAEPITAKYDVLDEQKQRPVVLLRDQYLTHSVFRNMLTVYVTAQAKGYFVKEVAVEGYDTIKVSQEIRLRKIPRSPIGVFYFEQSSAKMKDDYTSKLDSIVSVLHRNQHVNISIVGHTSADGNARLNRTLSLKRAKVIRRLLLRKNVDDERITVTGAGSSQPKEIRDKEEQQSVNRRVEVFLKE